MKNNVFHWSHGMKTSKQVVPVTYTLKKRLFVPATFRGLLVVSFRQNRKHVGLIVHFSRQGSNLWEVFNMQVFGLIW